MNKKCLEVILEHCQSSHFAHCLHSRSKIALPILWMVNLPNTPGARLLSSSHFTKAHKFNIASCHIASNKLICICSSLAQASKRVFKARKQTKYRKKMMYLHLPSSIYWIDEVIRIEARCFLNSLIWKTKNMPYMTSWQLKSKEDIYQSLLEHFCS